MSRRYWDRITCWWIWVMDMLCTVYCVLDWYGDEVKHSEALGTPKELYILSIGRSPLYCTILITLYPSWSSHRS